jgi:hypothetical protein
MAVLVTVGHAQNVLVHFATTRTASLKVPFWQLVGLHPVNTLQASVGIDFGT